MHLKSEKTYNAEIRCLRKTTVDVSNAPTFQMCVANLQWMVTRLLTPLRFYPPSRNFLSLSSSQIAQDKSQEIITSLLRRSYNQCNAILEDDLDISEIRLAVKHLKCGKAAGPDGITAEHIKYGGLTVLRWLQKVFNRILSLEDIAPPPPPPV